MNIRALAPEVHGPFLTKTTFYETASSSRRAELKSVSERHLCRSRARFFAIDQFPNEVRTRDDAEPPIFTLDQVQQRVTVQFLQLRKAQQRPQTALNRRMHQLVQIRQVAMEQFPGYANGHMISRRSIAKIHRSPRVFDFDLTCI